MDQNYSRTTYVKLFKGETQLSFGLGTNESAAKLFDMIDELISEGAIRGYTESLPGMNPDENLQDITGWVLGEKSDGEACIFLYHKNLQWKVAVVYLENFHLLPLTPEEIKKAQRWPGTAPEREVAENKGYMNPCTFTVIMEPSGRKTDAGKDIMKFSRTKGYTPREPESNINYASVYDDLAGAAKKLAEKMHMEQGKSGAKKLKMKDVIDVGEEIDSVTQRKGSYPYILQVLTGEAVLEHGLAENNVALLRKYLPSKVIVDGKKVPNTDVSGAYASAMALVWGIIESKVEELTKATAPKADSKKREDDIPF